ncbi:MAG: sulfatase-like hydrolase/transferase [Candidatus Hydrogenedentes bacterium]|nr:sulfatase-like hydrolase/transferase [Candidatus Hydrogenedentota bacterium]
MAKRILLFLIKLCVTAGLFVLLFRPETFFLSPDQFGGVKPGHMLQELREAGAHSIVFWLTFAAVVKLSGLFCGMLRWRLLLQGQGLSIPFTYIARSWFIGRTIGIFLPGTIGLDGYRLYDSSLYTGEVIKCTTVIAVEKLIGFVALTFLVFITFPLGFALLKINVVMLAIILLILAAFVAVAFIALLNPRVIQVLVAVVPTPQAIRTKVDKLGAAVTAYSGSRMNLIAAVFLGLGVHLATCFMYFGTMMSIRAENTGLADILFASPLMIYGTVLGPSIGGEGIREIVFVTLLGGKTSVAAAATFAHLGWWVGEVVPFLIGGMLLPFHVRPSKEAVQSKLAEARSGAQSQGGIHLEPAIIKTYRDKLVDCLLGGMLAGLMGGAVVGLAEAAWLTSRQAGLTEMVAYWWGPLTYGIAFAGAGVGLAAGLLFLALIVDRFPSRAWAFGICHGAILAGATLVIGFFRYRQDVLGEHNLSAGQFAMLGAAAVGIGVAGLLLGTAFMGLAGKTRGRAAACAAGVFLAWVIVGAGLSLCFEPSAKTASFQAKEGVKGPNIILIAVDALRADFLKLYSEGRAVAETPFIDALRADSVLYQHAFAQSSWTKASFATIFSGMYPEAHTAVQKDSVLPDSVTTFPEVLREAGYFTEGFANNPNIAPTYNYGQGFVQYRYLSPDYLFGANQSAEKMTLYKILRKVYQKVLGRLSKGRVDVRDFYQPAEIVTQAGLECLDSEARPKNVPFLLFLHYMEPHDPYMDHEKPGVGYARVQLGDNPSAEEYREVFKRVYNGEIEYCDQYIGELIQGLKDRGLYDDSVIVFTADHGEEFCEHGGWWHGLTLYDEQIGIPFMIKLPQNQLAGETNTNITRHVDLAPTLLQFAGLDRAPAMQGKSLFQADNVTHANEDGRIVYSHLDFEGILLQAVRTPTTKLIKANEGNKRNLKPVELYDVATDPGETANLAGRNLPTEQEMFDLIDQMQAAALENAVEPESIETPEDLKEKLDAIGYGG